MYHTHFNIIHSTQIYLRDNLVELKNHSPDILISTSEQTLGVGRRGSQWDSYSNSLAMSFTLKPNPVPTLTPIEIGILVIEFLKKEFDVSIFLKWPNDLLTKEKAKCGGIICQYIDTETVIAGLGLNLGHEENENLPPAHYKHGIGSVLSTVRITVEEQKNISEKMYQYILSNRIISTEIIQSHFNTSCIHIGSKVDIDDDGFSYNGKFIGIGKNGEALVEVDESIKSFLASSLKILN